AFLRLALVRGPHETENPVRPLRDGGPYLRTVDEEVVAHVLCLGLQRGKVRTRARLGIALAPEDVGLEDVRQEALLLLRRAELHDDGRHHGRTEGNGVR